MSDAAPLPQSSNATRESQDGPLTPERVEWILADFRDWLLNLPEIADPAPEPEAVVDLRTLIAQFTALRHEVNLQTKSSRATLDQNAEALRQMEEVVAELRAQQENEDAPESESFSELLKAIMEAYDALSLAARQVQKQREAILTRLDSVVRRTAIEAPPAVAMNSSGRRGFWKRLIGGENRPEGAAPMRDWQHSVMRMLEENDNRFRESCDYLRQSLDGMLTGYSMSLNRIDRVLPALGIEAMKCAGECFDPEVMEVVEVVADSGRPSGEVVDEVRRGYLRDGALFRCALVRVAR